MKAMRLVETGKNLVLSELEIPKVKGYEVLVRVRAAGVCHSDVHIRSGYVGGINVGKLGIKPPLTLGHEVAGVVEEIGEEVRGISKGDMVVVNPWQGCGACYYCKTGEENLCDNLKFLGIHMDGGFAEFVKVPHYRFLTKIKKLSPIEAAPLACSGVTAYRAVKKAELTDPSKTLLVVGVGGLGVMAIQIAKSTSGATVVGVDVREEALDVAKKVGADYVIDGRASDVVEEINFLTEGRGADAIIDFVGSEKTLSVYPFALSKRGKYIIVGFYGAELKHPSALLVFKETEFTGVHVGSQADFIGTVALAEKGKLKPVISKVMKLEEANEALDNIEQSKVVGRQILIP
ncbi:MAG: NAD(P)-dependent alcohol dehydrogenase [Candidatus Nezhaarchaeales archaeon]